MSEKNQPDLSLAERVKQLRRSKGLTQKDFAESLGIVQGYLSGIERGKKVPSDTLLMALCHVYQVTEDWLHGRNRENGTHFHKRERPRGKIVQIPLFRTIPEHFPEKWGDDVEYVTLPGVTEGCFAIVVDGDFMAPTIRTGDMAILRPGDDIANRSIVLMNNRWGEKILRRCRLKGAEIFFSSESSQYAPFKADSDTVIYGTVIDVWRQVRP